MPTALNLRLDPDECLNLEASLRRVVAQPFDTFRVLRRSIDARAGRPLKLQLRVELRDATEPPFDPQIVEPGPQTSVPAPRPVAVVGAGPAGLCCALELALHGVPVDLLDQGDDFPARHLAVRDLRLRGHFDGASNYRFGLGGAGTYSDGKLHTRVDGWQIRRALQIFAWYSSQEAVLVDSHPHLGSNRLIPMILRLRQHLAALGVRFHFRTKVLGLRSAFGGLGVLETSAGPFEAPFVVLAPGNGARELFTSLAATGIPLEARPLALGFRVEHPRALIDQIQFGPLADHPALGAAEYRVAHQVGSRPVYSFCMCPGGQILPTPAEEGRLCVNGASHSHRHSPWSNAAMVTQVELADLASTGPLAMLDFQRRLEEAAFGLAGAPYHAPAQRLTDFLEGRPSQSLAPSSYRPGLTPCDLTGLLPPPLTAALKGGLRRTGQLLRGYHTQEATLVALETSTSSPCRIPRLPDGSTPGLPWLYPCGEGSGHAGGISSSAGDGLRTARAILRAQGGAFGG